MITDHNLLIKNFKSLVLSGQLGHAYLFHGADQTGMKSFALALANFLENQDFNLADAKNPFFSDLLLVEPNEKKTIGIDIVRELKNFLSQRPNQSSRRMAMICQAEFLTTEAQNALLKIAEEPPESAILILITRDPEFIQETLVSRFNKIFFAGIENGIMNNESLLRQGFGGQVGIMDKVAERFLKVSKAERKEFIKQLIEPENFDILEFLDAVILNLARNKKMDYNLWHKVLKLRKDFSNFPLNPKLQLLNL